MGDSGTHTSSIFHALRTSIVAKLGGLFGLLALVYSLFLFVTTSLTSELIGVTAAINQAGTERMRIYRIGVLLLDLGRDTGQSDVREAIVEERTRWEQVLDELRSGSESQGALGINDPLVPRRIEELRQRWVQNLRPTIDLAITVSGARLQSAQNAYLAQADSLVASVAEIVHLLERQAAARTTRLYTLQLSFLVLSLSLMGITIVVLHRKVGAPLGRLTQRVRSLVAGDVEAPPQPVAADEVGKLVSGFEQVADNFRINVQELEALHATGQEITSLGVGGLENALRRIVDRAADLVHADLAILLVRHPMMDCWMVEAASGAAFDTLRHQIVLPEETPFANQTFETKQPVVVEELALYHDQPVHFRDQFGAKSYLGVPLLGPHDSMGILGLWSTSSVRHFTNRDVRAAQQFAVYASVAMENARLFDELESESRQLREKLKSVERTIAELTHEVKAPAGRVAEFASWIESDYGPRLDEKGLRYLSYIKKEGRDLADLAQRTLDVERLMKVSAPLESVDALEVIQEVTQLLSADCAKHGVRLDIVDSAFPRFACRRIHLRQILENLLSNAIKYIGRQPSPRVEIGCADDEMGPVLYVRDNGMGIDVSMREEIFLPFKRLVGHEIAGAGIGLSVVKTVAELYGGHVWVKSQIGVGSTFYVRLPAMARTRPVKADSLT
ncbi:ATP-binding protein [Nitrospira moscoviensis]|uniref:histidine kinase n=1 Tax=Nitrospira moscoviensis TaxID=42253 RepID=A0A0K2GHJ3_NITMO|nr:ATP-binding protein [Nitrospira moscoviensis]ALA60415.1 putative Histidine kinase [Nitrospira moscoviensis]